MEELEGKLIKLDTNLQLLEQKVESNKDAVEFRFNSYKNYTLIIAGLLSLIGLISIWTIITNIVKSSTEAKLNEILTEEYVEKKIRDLSAKTIQNLVSSTVEKATKAIEQSYTLRDWQYRASEAMLEGDIQRAVGCYIKAKEKIEKFSRLIDKQEISNVYLPLAEALIIVSEYDRALKILKEADIHIKDENYNKAIYLFLDCTAKKLLNIDFSNSESELNRLLKLRPFVRWDFSAIHKWVDRAKISEEDRVFIGRKIILIQESIK